MRLFRSAELIERNDSYSPGVCNTVVLNVYSCEILIDDLVFKIKLTATMMFQQAHKTAVIVIKFK